MAEDSKHPLEKLAYLDASEVLADLKQHVIGQDEFLEDFVPWLCMALRSRVLAMVDPQPDRPPVSCCMVIGPTASGKSHVLKSLCRVIDDIQYHFVDASNLTGSGWRGASVSDELAVIEQMQRRKLSGITIVVWDEFDKAIMEGNHVKGAGNVPMSTAQPAMLKLLEADGDYDFMYGHNSEDRGTVNTSSLIHVFSGSFEAIVDDRKRDEKHRMLGFMPADEMIRKWNVTVDDLIEIGMMTELAGRVNRIFELPALSPTSLSEIVTRDGGLAEGYCEIMPAGYGLDIDSKAALVMGQLAFESGFGARSLSTQISELVSDSTMNLPAEKGILCVTAEDGHVVTHWDESQGHDGIRSALYGGIEGLFSDELAAWPSLDSDDDDVIVAAFIMGTPWRNSCWVDKQVPNPKGIISIADAQNIAGDSEFLCDLVHAYRSLGSVWYGKAWERADLVIDQIIADDTLYRNVKALKSIHKKVVHDGSSSPAYNFYMVALLLTCSTWMDGLFEDAHDREHTFVEAVREFEEGMSPSIGLLIRVWFIALGNVFHTLMHAAGPVPAQMLFGAICENTSGKTSVDDMVRRFVITDIRLFLEWSGWATEQDGSYTWHGLCKDENGVESVYELQVWVLGYGVHHGMYQKRFSGRGGGESQWFNVPTWLHTYEQPMHPMLFVFNAFDPAIEYEIDNLVDLLESGRFGDARDNVCSDECEDMRSLAETMAFGSLDTSEQKNSMAAKLKSILFAKGGER